jgi:hypothetical protein
LIEHQEDASENANGDILKHLKRKTVQRLLRKRYVDKMNHPSSLIFIPHSDMVFCRLGLAHLPLPPVWTG